MPEKLNWEELFSEMTIVPDNGAFGNTVFPDQGAVFEEVFIVKLPNDDEPYFLRECLCEKLHNLLGEIGTYDMDESLFDKKDIITIPGLYVASLQYFYEDTVDWESGIKDYRPGFSIQKLQKM